MLNGGLFMTFYACSIWDNPSPLRMEKFNTSLLKIFVKRSG